MKKLISVVLAMALVLLMAACAGGKSGETETKNETTAATTAEATTAADGKKVLVVYYSSANTADADLVSKGTPYYDDVAATAVLANQIQKATGAVVVKLTPQADYPTDYDGVVDAAKQEADSDARPAFTALDVNPEEFDVIFVGYPLWWYKMPMLFYTFFDTYDFSGKTVIPFMTHAGSGESGTYDAIRALEPNAEVPEGIAINGDDVEKSEDEMAQWLEGLGY